MENLLKKIDERASQAQADRRRRYAQLLTLGDDAPPEAAEELADLMVKLGLSPDDVRHHANLIVEARGLEPSAARVDELHEAVTDAMLAFGCKKSEVEDRKRQLDEELRQCEHAKGTAHGRYEDAQTAAARLKIRADHAFLFWDSAGKPVTPPGNYGTLPFDQLPEGLDPRTASIDPAGEFTPEELARDFGIPAGILQKAELPRLPGNRSYLGVVVVEWLDRVAKQLRERDQHRLQEELGRLPEVPAQISLDPNARYDLPALREAGLPVEVLRTGLSAGLTRFGPDTYLGNELIEFYESIRERRAQVWKAIAEYYLPSSPAAVATIEPVEVAAEEPVTAPTAEPKPEPAVHQEEQKPDVAGIDEPKERPAAQPAIRGGRTAPSRRR